MIRVRDTATVLWLTLLWVLLWGNLSFANVLGGFTVALVVLAISRRTPPRRIAADDAARPRPLSVLYFSWFVFYSLVKANLQIAWEIITPNDQINTGVIAVPLRTDSDLAMMVVANVITLTPGTFTIEARRDPDVLYVHVLKLDDVEAVRSDLLRIEELFVRAFGSRNARAQYESNGAS